MQRHLGMWSPLRGVQALAVGAWPLSVTTLKPGGQAPAPAPQFWWSRQLSSMHDRQRERVLSCLPSLLSERIGTCSNSSMNGMFKGTWGNRMPWQGLRLS